MKNFQLFILSSIFAVLTASTANSQHTIQVDDGTGHYTILKGQILNPVDIFNFPVGGGTLLVSPTPGSPSLVWLTGGNTLIAGQVFGSVLGNPFDVVMQANGVEKMRLVSGGGVNINSSLSVTPFVSAGVVHNAAGGLLSSSLIIDADITANTIANSKLVNSAISLTSGGSLTLTGSPISLGGAGTVNLNTANPNSWTGTQTFGAEALTPNTPAAITTNTNDYGLSASNSYFRISSTIAVNLTGITGGVSGRVLRLQNVGVNTITLKSQTTSAATNQFDLPGGFDIILGPKGAITLIYDSTLGFWEVASTN